jgi:hypothetical protein
MLHILKILFENNFFFIFKNKIHLYEKNLFIKFKTNKLQNNIQGST